MNILLDTHTAIWFIANDERLPMKSSKLIVNPENDCFISTGTLWEMGIKYSLGKLKLKTDLDRVFQIFFETGFKLLPITPDHIVTNSNLAFHHRDPFDRIIISQAIHENYTIISGDVIFSNYNVKVIWD